MIYYESLTYVWYRIIRIKAILKTFPPFLHTKWILCEQNMTRKLLFSWSVIVFSENFIVVGYPVQSLSRENFSWGDPSFYENLGWDVFISRKNRSEISHIKSSVPGITLLAIKNEKYVWGKIFFLRKFHRKKKIFPQKKLRKPFPKAQFFWENLFFHIFFSLFVITL